MNKLKGVVVLGLVLVIAVILVSVAAQEGNPKDLFEGTAPAPEFPADLDWLNVDAPLTLDGLKGKIVLFDFWTYGCINCIHMLPILEQLEEKYANELVVIGVHSAKFKNEGETENIRQIVQRYDVHHPVINDSDFRVWEMYRIRAWPSFVVVDPRGFVVAVQAGEVPFDAFDRYISGMIDYYDTQYPETIDRTPLALALEGAGNPGTPLLFPGSVLADAENNRLFITDTNHHRIVIADLTTYEVLEVIGSGTRGLDNGDYATATFNKPQGLELYDNKLYVADVNNHVIRMIDLAEKTVSTIAGTGIMGTRIFPTGTTGNALEIDLRSPWAVAKGGENLLYIAMAGTHQIWRLHLETGDISVAVGNGREAQFNDTLAQSELAQPSGMYYIDGLLYFADSESSTIRVADFTKNQVSVVSGTTNNDLFDYGDIDGALGVNRLQHALGVVGDENGNLYIADTYNSKIKIVDPATQAATTLFGLGGAGGFRDGDAATAQFDEPGGLDYANGKLYVADTNNHAIRMIDLATGTVSTLVFPNPQALKIETNAVTIVGGNAAMGEVLALDAQTTAVGEGEIALTINLPEDYKLNPLTDSYIEINSLDDPFEFDQDTFTLTELSAQIPVIFLAGEGTLDFTVTLFYCEAKDEKFCLIDEFTVNVPVIVAADSQTTTITVERNVTPPQIEN